MPKRVTRSSTRTLESSSSSGGGLVIKISKKKETAAAAAAAVQATTAGAAEAVGGKGRKKATAEGAKRRKARPLTEEEKALQRAYRTLRAARAAAERAQKGKSATNGLGETEATALGGSGGSTGAVGGAGSTGGAAALERARSLAGSVAGMATLLRSSGAAAEELDEAARSALARQLQKEREREPQASGAPVAAPVAKRAEETDTAGAALGRAARAAAVRRQQQQTAAKEGCQGEGEASDQEMPEAGEQAMPYGHPAQAQAGYSTHTVFVGDISPNVMAHDLEDAFSCCGTVESVRVIPGKPFAFVQFTEAEFAQKALAEMNGASVCDCVIRVSPAKVQGSTGPPSSHWAPGPRGFAPPGRNFWDPTMGHMNAYAPPPHQGPPPAQVAPQLREHLEQQQIYGHLGPADADMDRGLVSYDDI